MRDLVDSGGTLRKHASYDAFGNVQGEQFFDASSNELSSTDTNAVDTLFGYTGRPYDAETDLQNNLHRWYDSEVGRWISQDPIGFAAGDGNLYRYVGNGPTTSGDPSGLKEPPIARPRTAYFSPLIETGEQIQSFAAAAKPFVEGTAVDRRVQS